MMRCRTPEQMRSKIVSGILAFAAVLLCSGAALAGIQYDLTCDTCHHMPPFDSAGNRVPQTGSFRGNHETHAGGTSVSCVKCHGTAVTDYLTGHRTKQIQVTGNINGSPATGTYQRTGNPAFINQTSIPPVGSCANVNCHFESTTELWGTKPIYTITGANATTCSKCHGAAPATGNHPVSGSRHADYFGTGTDSCRKCHPDHTAEGAPFAHATSAANRGIAVRFTTAPNSGGTYTGNGLNFLPSQHKTVFGNCNGTYCHSDGKGSGPNTPAAWNGSMPPDCSGCHGAGVGAAVKITSGSHKAHTDNAGVLGTNYSCDACHTKTAALNSSTALKQYSSLTYHVDGSKTTVLASRYGGTFSSGTAKCSGVMCHGSVSPVWGTTSAANTLCTKCHGMAGSTYANFSSAVIAPGGTDGTGRDTNGDVAVADKQVGAHRAHLTAQRGYSNPIKCGECHNVITGVSNAGHIDSALPADVPLNGWIARTNPNSVAGTPTYDPVTGKCSNVYCHDYTRFKNGYGDDGVAPLANRTPTWNSPILVGNSTNDCSACHGYPPALGHPQDSNCNGCHNHVATDNKSFLDKTLHLNGKIEGGGDACTDCHTAANLSPRHTVHSDPTNMLAGKSLTNSDYGKVSWWYSMSYAGGAPKYACGYCHPQSASTHRDGTKNLNFSPTDTGAAGTIKAKNAATQTYTQNPGVSVTCSSVYCHSNGYNPGTGYTYYPTPDWYNGTFAIADRCANCHGNSPNSGGKTGSAAHSGHVVGIHYDNIYTGTSGLATTGTAATNSHGSTTYSVTINCNLCHAATVTMSRNKLNTACTSCHSGDIAGYVMVVDTASTSHINGTVDVSFPGVTMKSRAQIRDNITTVTELNTSWSRSASSYKTGATPYDSAKALLTGGSYSSADKSCGNIACHNGYTVKWTDAVSCDGCHMNLP